VRREALEDVGQLEEEYFMYSEEMDLCYRLRQRGWSLYWVPQAEVVHYGGRSTRQAPAEMFLELYRSKVIYFRRNHGLLSAQCYKALLAIASIVRLVLVPIAWVEGPAQRERHFTLGRDYLRLLATLPRM
jgi:GT2 family glycosyltransferase